MVAFKKLSKKDEVTRSKGLDGLQESMDVLDDSTVRGFIEKWIYHFKTLAGDENYKNRVKTFETMLLISLKFKAY